MVVVSILPHAEFWPNDHREDATHFKVHCDQSELRVISLILDGIVGMEQIHPGMIEVGKKPITQNTDIQKEFSRLRPVEEGQTHTPEYDQVMSVYNL